MLTTVIEMDIDNANVSLMTTAYPLLLYDAPFSYIVVVKAESIGCMYVDNKFESSKLSKLCKVYVPIEICVFSCWNIKLNARDIPYPSI
jgi:hypothetical protein